MDNTHNQAKARETDLAFHKSERERLADVLFAMDDADHCDMVVYAAREREYEYHLVMVRYLTDLLGLLHEVEK